MKNKIRKVLSASIFMLGISFAFAGMCAGDEPNVVDIKLEPEEPTPGSAITFTLEISSQDDPIDVRILVDECKEDFCFAGGFNESMDMIESGVYQAKITLSRTETTYIQYHVEIQMEEGWYAYDTSELNLKIDTDNGDGQNGGNGTPGFEILTFLIAVSIGVLILRRKRLR